jgi:hypothetical protein
MHKIKSYVSELRVNLHFGVSIIQVVRVNGSWEWCTILSLGNCNDIIVLMNGFANNSVYWLWFNLFH